MIDPKKLTEDDIGRKVIYDDGFSREEGELSSFTSTGIWVRFRGPNGEKCAPDNISFSFGRLSDE